MQIFTVFDIVTAMIIGGGIGFCGCAWLARKGKLTGVFPVKD